MVDCGDSSGPSWCPDERFYWPKTYVLICNASSIVIESNLLVSSSNAAAVLTDRNSGSEHAVALSNASLWSITGNTMVALSARTVLDLGRCIVGISVASASRCYSDDNSATYIPGTLLVTTRSALVITRNAMTSQSAPIEWQLTSLTFDRGGTGVVSHNRFVSATVASSKCISIAGAIIIPRLLRRDAQVPASATVSSLSFFRNKCFGGGLVALTLGSGTSGSDSVTFACEQIGTRLLRDNTSYNSVLVAISVSGTGSTAALLFSSCPTMSYTEDPPTTRSVTHSESPTSGITRTVLHLLSKTKVATVVKRIPSLTTSITDALSTSGSVSVSELLSRTVQSESMSFSRDPLSRSETSFVTPSNDTTRTRQTPTLQISATHSRGVSESRASVSLTLSASASRLTPSLSAGCVDALAMHALYYPLFAVDTSAIAERQASHESISVADLLWLLADRPGALTSPESMGVMLMRILVGGTQPTALSVDRFGYRNISICVAAGPPIALPFHDACGQSGVRGSLLIFNASFSLLRFSFSSDEDNRELAARFVAPGDSFTVYHNIRDMFSAWGRVCQDDAAVAPLFEITTSSLVLSAAQLAVRNAMTAGSITAFIVQLFSGNSGSDLQALIMVGMMPCAASGTSMSNGFGALRVLAPALLRNSYFGVVYSNAMLVLGVLGVQCTAAAVVVAVRRWAPRLLKMKYIKSSAIANVKLTLSEVVMFPGMTIAASLYAYPGTLFAATRLIQLRGVDSVYLFDSEDGSDAAFAVGLVVVLCLFPMPAVCYWANHRISRSCHSYSVRLAESRQAYALVYRCFTFLPLLEPTRIILPHQARRRWGPLVTSTLQEPFWTVVMILPGWAMCVAALAQFYTGQAFCVCVFALLSLMNLSIAVTTGYYRPKRSPLLNVLAVCTAMVTSATLATSAATAAGDRVLISSDAFMSFLGLAQTGLSFANGVASVASAAGGKLQSKRSAVLQLEWSIGTMSEEAVKAERRRELWLRQRQKLRDLKKSADESWESTVLASEDPTYIEALKKSMKAEGLWGVMLQQGEETDNSAEAAAGSESCPSSLSERSSQSDDDDLLFFGNSQMDADHAHNVGIGHENGTLWDNSTTPTCAVEERCAPAPRRLRGATMLTRDFACHSGSGGGDEDDDELPLAQTISSHCTVAATDAAPAQQELLRTRKGKKKLPRRK